MERQLRAEVEEARQLAAAMQALRGQPWGAAEGDDDIIDAEFRVLCEAAGESRRRTFTGADIPATARIRDNGGGCVSAQ
eukprot:4770353-Prymnesium_polylepis.1